MKKYFCIILPILVIVFYSCRTPLHVSESMVNYERISPPNDCFYLEEVKRGGLSIYENLDLYRESLCNPPFISCELKNQPYSLTIVPDKSIYKWDNKLFNSKGWENAGIIMAGSVFLSPLAIPCFILAYPNKSQIELYKLFEIIVYDRRVSPPKFIYRTTFEYYTKEIFKGKYYSYDRGKHRLKIQSLVDNYYSNLISNELTKKMEEVYQEIQSADSLSLDNISNTTITRNVSTMISPFIVEIDKFREKQFLEKQFSEQKFRKFSPIKDEICLEKSYYVIENARYFLYLCNKRGNPFDMSDFEFTTHSKELDLQNNSCLFSFDPWSYLVNKYSDQGIIYAKHKYSDYSIPLSYRLHTFPDSLVFNNSNYYIDQKNCGNDAEDKTFVILPLEQNEYPNVCVMLDVKENVLYVVKIPFVIDANGQSGCNGESGSYSAKEYIKACGTDGTSGGDGGNITIITHPKSQIINHITILNKGGKEGIGGSAGSYYSSNGVLYNGSRGDDGLSGKDGKTEIIYDDICFFTYFKDIKHKYLNNVVFIDSSVIQRGLPDKYKYSFNSDSSQNHYDSLEIDQWYQQARLFWQNNEYEKAMIYYNMVVDYGKISPNEMYEIGMMYFDGKLHERQYNKAEEWLIKAAAQGHLLAQYRLGIGLLYFSISRDQALKYLFNAAEGGCPEAQGELGYLYHTKNFDLFFYFKQDPDTSVYWHQKAAAQSYSPSQYWLGYYYMVGWGVKKDYSKARDYLTAAVESGKLSSVQYNDAVKRLEKLKNKK